MKKFRKIAVAAIAGMTLAGCFGGFNPAAVQAAKPKKARVTKVTEKQINKYIKKASWARKVGQMYVGRTPQTPGQAEHDAYKYNIGGFIVYDADLEDYTTAQVKSKLASYQKAAHIPVMIGIDQEGGLVSRLTHSGLVPQNGDQFAFPRKQYQDAEQAQAGSGMKAVTTDARNTATLLHSLGVNWNYAPDADYSDNPASFIYKRGFGGVMGPRSYKGEANYIKHVIPAWQHGNLIAATLKHFPGYGDAADTHTGFAAVDKSKADIEKEDMLPFKAGIKAGADAVMVTHVIYNKIDPKYPASLSKKVDNLLRKNCHFKGVIVTDALEMGAITDFAKQHHTDADMLAIKAGNDMIMTTDYATEIPKIVKAIKKGQISKKQINNSVRRILNMKKKLHLLKPADLKLKRNSNHTFTMQNVAYDQKSKQATITGQAEVGTKVSLKNTDTKQVAKTAVADQTGQFTMQVPVTAAPQNFSLQAKKYVAINVHVSSSKMAFPATRSFTLNPVTYNDAHTEATISGQVPDAGAEGSLTMSILNAKTGNAIGSAVVGADGKFSTTLVLTDKEQEIKVVAEHDRSYTPQTETVAAK